MSKQRKKLLESMRKVLAWQRDIESDFDEYDIDITDSCGCVFCDLGLEPVDGVHLLRGGTEICGLLQ